MALWNKVVCGFDRDEETVNFGARAIAEKNGSLFETSTLATIQANAEVTGRPNISASVQCNRICIAIDKSITIFEDETCDVILLNVSFGSLISQYCVSDDGSFLFIVLASGVLHCLHLAVGGQDVFSKNVIESTCKVIKMYAVKDKLDVTNITLITANGSIYRVSSINTAKINSVIKKESGLLLDNIIADIHCSQVHIGYPNNEVIYASVGIVHGELQIALACSNSLFVWPSKKYTHFMRLSHRYRKILFLKSYDAMLCLRTDDKLNLVCPRTLLGLKTYDQCLDDFTIIGDENNRVCQILMLSKAGENGSTNLRLVSFPDFTEKIQITVTGFIRLIEIIDYCDGEIVFMECVNSSNRPDGIDTIRVKTMSESVPEYQLQRLVRRGLYDEAEQFARKYNLSVEPIYCSKAALFMSQLGPWMKENSVAMDLNKFIGILDKIDNLQYVVECCSKALVVEYKLMRELHFYARKRIMENDEKVKSDEHLNLLYSINSTLHKLETFHMIYGWQKKNCSDDENTLKEWIRFSRANVMDEYKRHLSMGEEHNFEAAALIWTRHLSGTEIELSVKFVHDIFAIVPKGISPNKLWPWISHFVPSLLSLLPDAITEVILWGYSKIKALEHSHRTVWPQIGIEFVEKFKKLLRFDENSQCTSIHQEYSSQNSALKQFILLMQALSDIQELKLNYRLAITLDAYSGEPMEVCHTLLNRIHVDVIPGFVNTFLRQYMLNNSLQSDIVFSSYIQKLIRNCKNWWTREEAAWEKKAVTIVELIQNIESKLRQTLDVLRRAPVPWSSTMTTLAETSCNFDHVLSAEIRTECNYVPIKLILKRYGYECISINDKLISRIIKENDAEMATHLDQLTKNDQSSKQNAFSCCVNYHLTRGNLKTVTKVLNSLENDIVVYCCLGVVNYINASLSLKDTFDDLTHHMELLGWIKCRMELTLTKNKRYESICENVLASISKVEPLFALKKEFNMYLSFSEYQTNKQNILQNYVKELCTDIGESSDLVAICKTAFRLGDLLNIKRLQVISLLIEYTKKSNILGYFQADEGKLNFTTEESNHISEICFLALKHIKLDTNTARVIKTLSGAALCNISPNLINDCVLPNSFAGFYYESFRHRNLASFDKKKDGPDANWRLYPIYKDLAIGTDHLILPILHDTLSVQKIHLDRLQPGEEKLKIVGEKAPQEEFINSVVNKIRTVKVEHNDYCLLQILKNLYYGYCATETANPSLLADIRTTMNYFIKTLLKKVMNARSFDLQLGLSCLFMLPERDAHNFIYSAHKSYQKDYLRHAASSIIGSEYFRLLKDKNKEFMEFSYYKTIHYWTKRLSKYSVLYKEMLPSDSTGQREVLQRLLCSNVKNIIPIIEDFCTAFGFNVIDCFLLYLETLVKTWTPTLDFTTSSGKKGLQIPEIEVSEIRQKCTEVAAKITGKEALKERITLLWPKINFYYYELFMILMDIVEDKNTMHGNLIYFLQNYTRTGQPTSDEYDEWLQIHPGHTSLPLIAKWRLPFLPKIELYTFIKPELNLTTYEKWLRIAPALKLAPNLICTLAVKEEIRRVWGDINIKDKTEKWAISPRNSTFLNDVKKCIERMSGPDAEYYSITALNYVVNHTPPGADLVAAAKECYMFAENCTGENKITLEVKPKITVKYLRFSCEHILRTHGLGVNRYLMSMENPEQLIRDLYGDDSIPKRYRNVTHHRPDVNAVVDALAKLFTSINIVKIRLDLLHEWLQPDITSMKINSSFTEDFSSTYSSEQNTNHDDNLLRTCYMLEYGNIELSANLLINIAFVDSNKNYGSEVRYRALQVLQTILDTDALENLTKRNRTTIRNYMRSLQYIGKLEALGLVYSTEAFEACSKYELVQILWQTQCRSVQALSLIAYICIDFHIYEYTLWDKILNEMAKLSMINELKNILLHLRNVTTIVNCDGYLAGWQAIVSEPFKAMDIQPSEEQMDNCVNVLRLLHSCPMSHMLQFMDIINYCLQSQQPQLIVALLPFLNDVDKQVVLQTISQKFTVEQVEGYLTQLESNGVLLITHCRRILQEVILEA